MTIGTQMGAAGALVLLLLGPLPLSLVIERWLLPSPPQANVRRSNQFNNLQGVSNSLLVLGVLCFAWHFSLATLLAVTGTFTLLALLLSEGAVFAIGLVLLFRVHTSFAHWKWWIEDDSQLGHQRGVIILLITVGFIVLLTLGNLLIQPVTDYDSLYYHLPFMANLHATAQLTDNSVVPVVAWYPFGWETLGALFLLPMESDLLVALPNLLVWMFCGLALYCVARQLGTSRFTGIAVALLFLTQPLVLDQLNSLRVDLALVTFVVAGVALMFAASRVVALLPALLALFLLPAIKVSGIIYAGLLGLLLVARLRWLFAGPHPYPDKRAKLAAHVPPGSGTKGGLLWVSGVLLLATLGTTLSWYLHNWLTYGNPLGIVAVQLGPWLLFPGSASRDALAQTTLVTLFSFGDMTHLQLYLIQLWQQGNLPLLVLVGFACGVLLPRPMPEREDPSDYAHRKETTVPGIAQPRQHAVRLIRDTETPNVKTQRTPRHITNAISLVLIFVLFSILYWITPYSGDDGSFGYQLNGPWVGQAMRFALPALAALSLLAGLGLERFYQRSSTANHLALGIVLFASLGALAQRSTLYMVAVGGMLVLLLLLWAGQRLVGQAITVADLWQRYQQQNERLTTSFRDIVRSGALMVILLLFGFGLLLPRLEQIRDGRRANVYGPLPTLIETSSATHTRIGALYSHQSYLANGRQLKRQVIQLPMPFSNAQALYTLLREWDINLVVIGPLRAEWQELPEAQWLAAPNAPYTLLYDGGTQYPSLYRVEPVP